MSERKTLADRLGAHAIQPSDLDRAVLAISDEIESIRALYEARVAYLEHQNEQLQSRIAVLEALSG